MQQSITNLTLIAKPIQVKVNIRYAISTSKGFYKLKLDKDLFYNLNISHLGFKAINKDVRFLADSSSYNIQLNIGNESLEEVVIDYRYEPIKK